MAIEFALAVVSGLIVALISSFFQQKEPLEDSLLELEVVHRTEVVIRSTTFVDGVIAQQDTEARIEESTFRLPLQEQSRRDFRVPVAAGVLISIAVLALLLVI